MDKKSKESEKGSAHILLVVLCFVVLVAGVYFIYQQQPSSSQSNVLGTRSGSSNWFRDWWKRFFNPPPNPTPPPPTPAPTPTHTAAPTPASSSLPIRTAPPTPRPTATSAASTGTPIAYTIIDSTPVIDFTVAGDQGGVMASREDRYKYLANVPESARSIIVTTIVDLEAQINKVPYKAGWLVYDIEEWDLTSDWEIQNPVEATKQAKDIADKYGMKLAVVPTMTITRKSGTAMAPYAVVFKVQSKAIQANSTPSEFGATLNPIYDQIRAANPQIKVYADISPNPKGEKMTPQQLLEYWNAVKAHADGISAWVASIEDETTFGNFTNLIGR